MSYKFDDKMKEGLERGSKLFNKVLREKRVIENADEDLAEYYEKTVKTSPGLERGKKIFSNSWQCLECGKKFRDAASAERAVNGSGCPGCGGTDIDDVPEKQNGTGVKCEGCNKEMSPAELIKSEDSGTPECDHCRGFSMNIEKKTKFERSNSPETTDGAANIVKGSGLIKSIESTPDNDNLVGYVESKNQSKSSDCESESSHLSKENSLTPEQAELKWKEASNALREKWLKEAKCVQIPATTMWIDILSNHAQESLKIEKAMETINNENEEGFRGQVGLDNKEKVEYPHDILPNNKSGLNKGSSKYGSLKNDESENGGPGSGPRPGHGKGESEKDILGFKKGEGTTTSADSDKPSGWRTVARQKVVADHPKVKQLSEKEDGLYKSLQKELARVFDAVGDKGASEAQDRDPKIAEVRKQLRQVMDEHNAAIDAAYEEIKKK